MMRDMSTNSIPIIRAESVKVLKAAAGKDQPDAESQTTEVLGTILTPASSLRDFSVV
jgi:hypothetical protein